MNERYSRQVLFAPIGPDGQRALSDSRVLILGCGALGASHAEMLGRAGVGFLRLADRDFVELSNLQRQTLFSEDDARNRIPKAIAAKNRLSEINSETELEAVVADVNQSNAADLIADVDLIMDGTDNFQVRYLINDASVKLGKPWIYGAAVSSYGTTMTIIPGKTPCMRCIFEEMPPAGSSPTCDTAGVLQSVVVSVSSIQVTEAIKLLTGNAGSLHGSLLQVDVWNNDWRKIETGDPNPECKACGLGQFEFLNADVSELVSTLCGRDAIQIMPPNAVRIDLKSLSERLRPLGMTKQNEYLLRLDVDGYELTVFRDSRAIIKGTDDPSVARNVYAKYVGS